MLNRTSNWHLHESLNNFPSSSLTLQRRKDAEVWLSWCSAFESWSLSNCRVHMQRKTSEGPEQWNVREAQFGSVRICQTAASEPGSPSSTTWQNLSDKCSGSIPCFVLGQDIDPNNGLCLRSPGRHITVVTLELGDSWYTRYSEKNLSLQPI